MRRGEAHYDGSVLATNLKVSGVNVFSAGDFLGGDGTEQIVLSAIPASAVYKKLVIANGRLVGAVLFGDTADGLWYLDLIRSGASIAAMRDDLCSAARWPSGGSQSSGSVSSKWTSASPHSAHSRAGGNPVLLCF